MAFLETLGGHREPIPVGEPHFLIGRSETCDLVLDDVTVSRHHARLECRDDEYFIEDAGSRHGTLLNGVPINGRTRVRGGDVIAISSSRFRFHEGDAADFTPEDDVPEGTIVMSTLDARVEPDRTAEKESGLKLRAVMEILSCLNRAPRVRDLLQDILESLFRIFPQAAHGIVFLGSGESGEDLRPVASRNRTGEADETPRASQTIFRQAVEKKQAILSADALNEESFRSSHSVSSLGIHSVMCVPLLRQSGTPLGVLQIYSEISGRAFTEDDLEILVSVANTIAMALENVELHESQLSRERLQRELELAREVQERFLPASPPRIAGYGFDAHYDAAQRVGGDYYGFVELPDRRLGIAIGDVSGKGMPAAMMMARLSSDVRYALLTHADPGEALAAIHRSLIESEIEDKFVTMVLMVLDIGANTLTLANAGHMPPLRRHADGRIDELDGVVAGYPLMVSPSREYGYRSTTVAWEPGQLVVAYTDGVVEAMNSGGDLFGLERLRGLLATCDGSPADATRRIVAEVQSFVGRRPQHDDLTLICGRREA